MKIRTTGNFDLADEIKDMEYLAHLSAVGESIIERSVFTGPDVQAVTAAHVAFLKTLHRAYQAKWAIGREGRARQRSGGA
jgi:hypothetical protein